ncbi:hypothetical protein HYY75_00585 [bacterium]|nr:hypothetical protein [bacterium]
MIRKISTILIFSIFWGVFSAWSQESTEPVSPTGLDNSPMLSEQTPGGGIQFPPPPSIPGNVTPEFPLQPSLTPNPIPAPPVPPPVLPPSGSPSVPASPIPAVPQIPQQPLYLPPVNVGPSFQQNLPPIPGVSLPAPAKPRGLGREETNYIRQLIAGICILRKIPLDPKNENYLGKLLETPHRACRLLGLAHFPILPRFYLRHDETTMRDKSFQAYEYRKFGAFQTRLDGWIKPVAFYIHFDLLFNGRVNSFAHFSGNLTCDGPLTGTISVKGRDAYARVWKLQYTLKELLITPNP